MFDQIALTNVESLVFESLKVSSQYDAGTVSGEKVFFTSQILFLKSNFR